MTRSQLLAILPTPTGKETIVSQCQTVDDIMDEVMQAHLLFRADYDKIACKFIGGSVCKNLYDFCRANLRYVVESEELQTTRSPGVLLSMGCCDCKGYAGFVAGVLDALNRMGRGKYNWCYRFANYDMTDDVPGHVFVVVCKPDGSEIWIDPVLNGFNKRQPVPVDWIDQTPPEGGTVGSLVRMSGTRIGSAETDLFQAMKAYENGLAASVQALQQTGKINEGVDAILKAAAASTVPGAAQAMAIANAIDVGISQTFGPGSTISRVSDALLKSNVLTAPINVVKAAFSGRTFNTQTYMLASDYYYHVLGIDKGASTNISDADVVPAMQWFITKLGVFMPGRNWLGALRNSVDEYLSLAAANPYGTQDRVRLEYARQVILNYFPNVLVPKNWANAVGVYDNTVTADIFKARVMNPQAQTDTSGQVPVQVNILDTVKSFAAANPIMTIGLAAALIYFIYEISSD